MGAFVCPRHRLGRYRGGAGNRPDLRGHDGQSFFRNHGIAGCTANPGAAEQWRFTRPSIFVRNLTKLFTGNGFIYRVSMGMCDSLVGDFGFCRRGRARPTNGFVDENDGRRAGCDAAGRIRAVGMGRGHGQ